MRSTQRPETDDGLHHLRRLIRSAGCSVACLLALVPLGACMATKTAPHERPEITVVDTWDVADEHVARTVAEPDWWRNFEDPYLTGLIESALEANLDLAVLAARTDTATVAIDQAGARLLPTLTNTTGVDTYGSPEIGYPDRSRYSLGNEMQWEIDVWGKAKQGVRASKARYQASEAEYRAAFLKVVADVAGTYFELRQHDDHLDQQRYAIERNAEILSIYRDMQEHGLTTFQEVRQQEGALAALKSDLVELELLRDLAENRLATLVGKQAGTLDVPKIDTPLAQVTVPVGLPSDLVARRPDIVAAEYRILERLHLEGQARLAQLPSFGLTGRAGTAGWSLKDVGDAFTTGFTDFFTLPLFDPNLRAQIRVSEKQVAEAEAEYRRVVRQSLEEVQAALTTLARHNEQRELLHQRFENYLDARHMEQEKLEAGFSTHLELLQLERDLLAAEQDLTQNGWAIAHDTVILYKAVGGSWPHHVVDVEQD